MQVGASDLSPVEEDVRRRYERLQSLARQARTLAGSLRFPLVGNGLLEHAAALEREAERLGAPSAPRPESDPGSI